MGQFVEHYYLNITNKSDEIKVACNGIKQLAKIIVAHVHVWEKLYAS